MNRYASCFIVVYIIVFFSIFTMIYAQNDDSISYYRIRNNYIEIFGENKLYKEYINVSDGLASAKLFQEAEDILTDLFKEDQYSLLLDTTNAFKNESVEGFNFNNFSSEDNSGLIIIPGLSQDSVSWRITSSGSYNKYQYQNEVDNDTSVNNPDSITSNSPISNDYFSGYFSLRSDWIPKSNFIKKISPYFYISDYYGKLGSKIELSFLNKHIRVDGDIHGKLPMDKKYRDSSSAILTKITTKFISPKINKNSTSNSINFQLDLNFNSTQNRKDRSIDISNRQYTIKPTFEWTTEDYRKNSYIGFYYNYKDYNRYTGISSDTTVREDDRYNLGPFIEADFWNEFFSASIYWSLLWEYYLKRRNDIPGDDATSNRNSFLEIYAAITPVYYLELYLMFNHDMLLEHFPCYEISIIDTNYDLYDDTISYESKTHYFKIEPELFIYYRSGIGNSFKFLYERQTMSFLSETQYIDSLDSYKIEDDYYSYLIGISFFTNFKKFSFETGFNYIKRHIIKKSVFSNGDSFELVPDISFSWRPLKWLSFSLDGQLGYLKYLESSEPEIGTVTSLGCRLTF